MTLEIQARYRNRKGNERVRKIMPIELWYGATNFHSKSQWLIRAKDCEDGVVKDFALDNFDFTDGTIRAARLTELLKDD